MVASGPLDGYLRDRSHLLATATPGLSAARSLSGLTDDAVRGRAEAAEERAPYALFALGGYGAGRLLPASDIDLLIVSDGPRLALEPLVRAMLYPLWDTGLTVGHQIRTSREQLQALSEDLTSATAFLTARQIAGHAELGDRVIAASFRRLRRNTRSLQISILERERPGSPYLLEPNLKDGCGGQRDLDEISWHAALRHGAPGAGLDAFRAAGPLAPADIASLSVAAERIAAARWALHRDDPRGSNLLTLEAAESAGIDADALQRSLADVHHILLALRDHLRGAASTDKTGTALSIADLRALARGDSGALARAERAAHHRRYDSALPGFGDMLTLRRPALSHRFAVGAHCLRAVNGVGHELDTLGPTRVPNEMRDAALVAALAHDAGKREPAPGHATRSAPVAEAAARALGLSERQAQVAGILAREHLLLTETVAHGDTGDEDVVLAAAARLGERELVAPLFALAAADMRATGPDVWTTWREAVLGDLAAKLEDALSAEVDGAGIVRAAEATRSSASRRAASAGSSRAVLEFLEHAPLRYLARRTPDEVLRDAQLVRSIAGPGAPGRFAFSVSPGPAERTWTVDVVTRDRPGLFAAVSGTLALCGLSTLSAEAYTNHSGIALDTFAVTSATLAPADPITWTAFERTLSAALSGALSITTRLAERRLHYPARPPGNAQTSVEIGAQGAYSTPVRVTAPDRVGLLYDLARTLEAAQLDVRRAAVDTLAGVASDVFDVVDADGTPPEPDELRRRLAPALLQAASTSSPGP